ncbi:MAG TPA: AAA family ATPase [Actinomycetota bacterium]|nr:AAA family ATPase [Actinomycetota bacterium]
MRRTDDDLVQLSYRIAERQLADQVRAALGDWQGLASAHLNVAPEDIASLQEELRGPYEMPLLLLLGQQLAEHPSVEFGGANPKAAAEWQRVDIGGVTERIPSSMTVYWDAGMVASAPLLFATWRNTGARVLVVRSAPADTEVAQGYLDSLIADARGPDGPYRGRLLRASWTGPSVGFEVLPDPTERRDHLMLPSEIWTSLDMNVHRMFARMDVFRSAGLGSNRGLLLAGPPGTGRTAACRILAAELLGTATPIFVESKVGEYVLHQLYEELSGLGPALVLLEDLDLLAG